MRWRIPRKTRGILGDDAIPCAYCEPCKTMNLYKKWIRSWRKPQVWDGGCGCWSTMAKLRMARVVHFNENQNTLSHASVTWKHCVTVCKHNSLSLLACRTFLEQHAHLWGRSAKIAICDVRLMPKGPTSKPNYLCCAWNVERYIASSLGRTLIKHSCSCDFNRIPIGCSKAQSRYEVRHNRWCIVEAFSSCRIVGASLQIQKVDLAIAWGSGTYLSDGVITLHYFHMDAGSLGSRAKQITLTIAKA